MFGDAKVGSLEHGWYSNGESGTLSLICTVCKSVNERGCEESEKMVTFASLLKENFSSSDIPLYPFLRNCFNILFSYGGGVVQLYDNLLTFLDSIEKENKLLTVVYWDLSIVQYKVGCCCVVLIHN